MQEQIGATGDAKNDPKRDVALCKREGEARGRHGDNFDPATLSLVREVRSRSGETSAPSTVTVLKHPSPQTHLISTKYGRGVKAAPRTSRHSAAELLEHLALELLALVAALPKLALAEERKLPMGERRTRRTRENSAPVPSSSRRKKSSADVPRRDSPADPSAPRLSGLWRSTPQTIPRRGCFEAVCAGNQTETTRKRMCHPQCLEALEPPPRALVSRTISS